MRWFRNTRHAIAHEDDIVMLALLRLFKKVAEVLPRGSTRLAILDQAAVETLTDAERSIPRQPSLDRIRAAVRALRSKIDSQRSVGVMADEFGGRS
jgi:hypothetical protein